MAGWAAGLDFRGLQIPTGNVAIFDLEHAVGAAVGDGRTRSRQPSPTERIRLSHLVVIGFSRPQRSAYGGLPSRK
jgi:hypothetical protein